MNDGLPPRLDSWPYRQSGQFQSANLLAFPVSNDYSNRRSLVTSHNDDLEIDGVVSYRNLRNNYWNDQNERLGRSMSLTSRGTRRLSSVREKAQVVDEFNRTQKADRFIAEGQERNKREVILWEEFNDWYTLCTDERTNRLGLLSPEEAEKLSVLLRKEKEAHNKAQNLYFETQSVAPTTTGKPISTIEVQTKEKVNQEPRPLRKSREMNFYDVFSTLEETERLQILQDEHNRIENIKEKFTSTSEILLQMFTQMNQRKLLHDFSTMFNLELAKRQILLRTESVEFRDLLHNFRISRNSANGKLKARLKEETRLKSEKARTLRNIKFQMNNFLTVEEKERRVIVNREYEAFHELMVDFVKSVITKRQETSRNLSVDFMRRSSLRNATKYATPKFEDLYVSKDMRTYESYQMAQESLQGRTLNPSERLMSISSRERDLPYGALSESPYLSNSRPRPSIDSPAANIWGRPESHPKSIVDVSSAGISNFHHSDSILTRSTGIQTVEKYSNPRELRANNMTTSPRTEVNRSSSMNIPSKSNTSSNKLGNPKGESSVGKGLSPKVNSEYYEKTGEVTEHIPSSNRNSSPRIRKELHLREHEPFSQPKETTLPSTKELSPQIASSNKRSDKNVVSHDFSKTSNVTPGRKEPARNSDNNQTNPTTDVSSKLPVESKTESCGCC